MPNIKWKEQKISWNFDYFSQDKKGLESVLSKTVPANYVTIYI